MKPNGVSAAPRYVGLEALLADWDVPNAPGLALGVMHADEVVYSACVGCAILEHQLPISSTTVFDVGSVAKQFTAFAVLLLVEEGALSLDNSVSTYLPELNQCNAAVTLRHLLHHTSGVRDYLELAALAGWRSGDDALALINRQRELNFAPGEKHLYSNSGYVLLAEVAARTAQQSFPAFAHERIFAPLQMTQSCFIDDHLSVVPRRAESYRCTDAGEFVRAPSNIGVLGDGGLMTTLDDSLKWIANLRSGRVGGAAVSAAMRASGSLNSGAPVPYGGGLLLDDDFIYHSGEWAGYRALTALAPERDLAVVVLANVDTVSVWALLDAVTDVVYPKRTPNSASRQVTGVSLDRDAFGPYWQPQGGIVEVLADDDTVWLCSANFTVELLGKSDGNYLVADTDDCVRFERNAAGAITQFHLVEEESLRWLRLDRVALRRDALLIYTGLYHSAELDTTYTVTLRGRELCVEHSRLDRITLTPLRPRLSDRRWDTFEADGYCETFRFTRVARNITGFRVYGSRAQGVAFDKIGSDALDSTSR